MPFTSYMVFLMVLVGADAAKILLIPGPVTSHCREMMPIAEELLKRGHVVTLFSMLLDPKRCVDKETMALYKPRFRTELPDIDVSYFEEHDKVMSKISTMFFERKSLTAIMKEFVSRKQTDCETAFIDTKLLENLQKEKYDLALVEGVAFMGCFFAIPVFLDVPAVAVASYIDFEDSRMPLQTNTFPSVLTEYSNEMAFTQRLINTFLILIHPVFRYFFIPDIDLSKYSERLAGYDSRGLMKNCVLFIETSDYIIDYPKAVFPNFVQVGPLTAKPAKLLPANIKKLLDDSKQGTVLVTFGSFLTALPPNLNEKLMTVFGRLKLQIIFKQDRNEVRGNVKIMKWVPQNDILGHPNTKLFISHCGKNGFWESVYHGVPIICMAVHAETYTTKVKVKKYGIGSSINIFDDSVDDLVETINGVLANDSIYKNMKRISTLLRDRPETPRQRAASAIEHVIKYGGDHMRPPSVEFGFLSYTNIDVWFTLFSMDIMLTVFMIWLFWKYWCRQKSWKRKTD